VAKDFSDGTLERRPSMPDAHAPEPVEGRAPARAELPCHAVRNNPFGASGDLRRSAGCLPRGGTTGRSSRSLRGGRRGAIRRGSTPAYAVGGAGRLRSHDSCWASRASGAAVGAAAPRAGLAAIGIASQSGRGSRTAKAGTTPPVGRGTRPAAAKSAAEEGPDRVRQAHRRTAEGRSLRDPRAVQQKGPRPRRASSRPAQVWPRPRPREAGRNLRPSSSETFGHRDAEDLIPGVGHATRAGTRGNLDLSGVYASTGRFGEGHRLRGQARHEMRHQDGQKQMRRYQNYFDQQEPLRDGHRWRGKVATYNKATLVRVLKRIGWLQ
jgi:hypothetical protein